MPLPMISDVIRCSVEGASANGHKFAYVLHHRKTGALTFPGAIAILDPKLFAFWNTALGTGAAAKANMPTSAALTQIRYTPLDASSATTVIAHPLAGTNVSEAMPASTCLVATLRTNLRGRSFRGRMYNGNYCETHNIPPGVPTAATVSDLANQFAGYIASLAGTGVSLVVASYKLATATDVASVTVDNRWDTQRRRLNT